MDLSILNSWQSIGKDLYKAGYLEKEIAKIKKRKAKIIKGKVKTANLLRFSIFRV
jgi:hypothetical protein